MFGAGRFSRSSALCDLVKSLPLSEPQIGSARSPQDLAWEVRCLPLKETPALIPALSVWKRHSETQMLPACGVGLGQREGWVWSPGESKGLCPRFREGCPEEARGR